MKTVIEMAREVGFTEREAHKNHGRIERLIELVRAEAVRENSTEYRMGWNDGQVAEREACADLCYQLVDNSRETRFATTIRARSNQ